MASEETDIFAVKGSETNKTDVPGRSESSRDSSGTRKDVFHRRKERKHVRTEVKAVQLFSSSPSPPGEGWGTKKPRVRRGEGGKPSRRWLALEVERLFRDNVELASGLKAKEEIERSLVETIRRLEDDLERAKRDSERKDDDAVGGLRARNRELSQDVFLMKNLVVRLNAELEKCQDKVRHCGTTPTDDGPRRQQDDCPTISEDSGLADIRNRAASTESLIQQPTHQAHVQVHAQPPAGKQRRWIRAGELTVLGPLLEAYDESIKEKQSLISDYKEELDDLAGKMKDILVENQELRDRLQETDKKGEITYSEWLVVQKESAITREQNELLMRQVKLGQAKFQELRSAFQLKLDECTRERDDGCESLQQCKTELFMLKGRFSALLEEHTRLKEQVDTKIPQSVHMASINECKRLFEELKLRYDREREDLLKRVAAVEGGRPEFEARVASLATERDMLKERVAQLEAQLRGADSRASEAQDKLARGERSREELRRQLAGSVAFSGELLREQESLLRKLAMTAEEAAVGNQLGRRLEGLRQQIQGVEREADEQMTALDRELRDKAGSLSRVRQREAVEMAKMKELVARQQTIIDSLNSQNEKAKEELEAVWAAATGQETKD